MRLPAVLFLTLALIAPPLAAADGAGEEPRARDFFPGSEHPTVVRERLANRVLGRKRSRDPAFDDYYATVLKQFGQTRDDFLILTSADTFVNAFAHFGGIVVMTEGMWQFARNESEFTAIIAHEMGHVKQKHFSRLRDEAKKSAAVSVPILIAGLLAGDGETRQALVLGSGGIAASHIYAFTREMEHEADTYGLKLIRKTGGNARSLADALSRMEGGGEEYLSTHPAISRRVGYLRDRLHGEDNPAAGGGSLEFRLLQNKIAADGGVVSRLLPVLRANIKDGDANIRNGARYGMLLLAIKKRDTNLMREMRASLGELAGVPLVAAAFAESFLFEKKPARALEVLRDSFGKNPRSATAGVALMKTLNRLKRKEDAAALFDELPDGLQKRPDILRLAAANESDRAIKNLLLARAHFYNGDFEKGLRQASIADKAAKDKKISEEIAAFRKTTEQELRTIAEQADK